MAQVQGNPEEMRRFAQALRHFSQELEQSTRRIDQQSKSVGQSWRDQEYQKFIREWDRTLQMVHRFLREAPSYERHVMQKAQALEEYLRSGGF